MARHVLEIERDMAGDMGAGVQVFVGGEDPDDVFLAYGNTVECR